MKTFSAGLAAAYASGGTTLCACLRVLRTGTELELFTSHDQDVIVGGDTYSAATGLDISNLVAQASLAVDNMEIVVLPDETSYPQVDILAGRWDGAKFWLFECDYTDVTIATGSFSASRTDINLFKRGTTGESDTLRVTNRFEFRGLKQALQVSTLVPVMSKTCRYRLGDENCTLDIADWTVARTVIAVDSRRQFTLEPTSSAIHDDTADDFYKEGEVVSIDGLNEGYRAKVKAYGGGSEGLFTLSLPLPFDVQVGDTFDCIAGDQKRFEEDCIAKFNNGLNFGGEPHATGIDLLTADPLPSA